jgi:hypothetical protein
MAVHSSPTSSFKSQNFLDYSQDSAFNENGEITQAGGLQMYGSTRVAVIEVACHRWATVCVETEGGHFVALF